MWADAYKENKSVEREHDALKQLRGLFGKRSKCVKIEKAD